MTSVLAKNAGKAFIHRKKNILFSYDIIRGIQQATSISFFPFVGNQCGNGRKTGARSEHRFLARSRVLPQNNLEKGQLLPVIQNFVAPSKTNYM